MTAKVRCADCKHVMLRRSPDGLGPGCRRKRRDRWRNTSAGRLAAMARRLFGTPTHTIPGQLAIPKEHITVAEARLTCLDEQHAATVVSVAEDALRRIDTVHTIRQDGADVVIGYVDKRWPLDVADWAGEHGHATDSDAAAVIAGL
ncbi:hypothetical protein OG824_31540 [Streptomyces prunicolor]|uniref:hypothetical protein n=1 Tax=Streptomyces prunicolor TaxID=67348 RepID=UPI0022511D93|nr:hypothetical protein [Streptomyces prunicolor]MCX5239743.1 hypothetical protein [Streptomyces prunicolor]